MSEVGRTKTADGAPSRTEVPMDCANRGKTPNSAPSGIGRGGRWRGVWRGDGVRFVWYARDGTFRYITLTTAKDTGPVCTHLCSPTSLPNGAIRNCPRFDSTPQPGKTKKKSVDRFQPQRQPKERKDLLSVTRPSGIPTWTVVCNCSSATWKAVRHMSHDPENLVAR